MPVTFYTAQEFDVLQAQEALEKRILQIRVEALELMRPVWASENTHISDAALGQLWKCLNVTNQTAAVLEIKRLQGNK